MSDLHVICSCPEPDAYPFGCCCLNLDIISPEMHAINYGMIQMSGGDMTMDYD